jgi:hypothetical protein
MAERSCGSAILSRTIRPGLIEAASSAGPIRTTTGLSRTIRPGLIEADAIYAPGNRTAKIGTRSFAGTLPLSRTIRPGLIEAKRVRSSTVTIGGLSRTIRPGLIEAASSAGPIRTTTGLSRTIRPGLIEATRSMLPGTARLPFPGRFVRASLKRRDLCSREPHGYPFPDDSSGPH